MLNMHMLCIHAHTYTYTPIMHRKYWKDIINIVIKCILLFEFSVVITYFFVTGKEYTFVHFMNPILS